MKNGKSVLLAAAVLTVMLGVQGVNLQGVSAQEHDENPTSDIINANYENRDTADKNGGALYIDTDCVLSEVSIIDSTFKGNKTSTENKYGGAVYSAVDLVVKGSTFGGADVADGNSTNQGPAGALYIDNANLTVTQGDSGVATQFMNNVAQGAAGGAISIMGAYNNPATYIDNSSEFNSNIASTTGGAIYSNYANLILNGTQFNANSAETGGAIGYFYMRNTNITDARFQNNIATGDSFAFFGGGAINTDRNGILVVTNSDFEGNKAKMNGGAVYSDGSNRTFIDSNFTNNKAEKDGGAIYNDNSIGNSIINIIAQDESVEFTGNLSNVVYDSSDNIISSDSNAIHNKGIVNLNAYNGKSITFNDGISGTDGVLNINNNITYQGFESANSATVVTKSIENTIGNVIFNQNVSGNTVNIYNGITNNNATLTGDVNIYGGELVNAVTTGSVVGDIVIDSSGTLTNNGSISNGTLKSSGIVTNSGSITGNITTTGGVFNNNATLADTITIQVNGGTFKNNASAQINSDIEMTAGSFDNLGTINSNVIEITNGTFVNTGSLGVVGSELIIGNITDTDSPNFTNDGTLNSSQVSVMGGLLTNNSTLSGELSISGNGQVISDADNLTNASAITNTGILTLTGGETQQNIEGSGTSLGTVNIAGNVTVSKAIENNIKLNQGGTLNLTAAGNIENANMLGGDGLLSVQDDSVSGSAINVGNIDLTDGNLNIAIDANISSGLADVIHSNSTVVGDNKILVNQINVLDSSISSLANPIIVADDSVKANFGDFANCQIVGGSGLGNVNLAYDSNAGALVLSHATIQDAVNSSVITKTYDVSSDIVLSDNLGSLGGESLTIKTPLSGGAIAYSIDGNGKDGIKLGTGSIAQTLDIKTSHMSGFGTLLNNGANGTVNLTSVVLGDIQNLANDAITNDGEINIVGLANDISSKISGTGDINIKDNTVISFYNEVSQANMTIGNTDAYVIANAKDLCITNGIANGGQLTITGGGTAEETLESKVLGSGDTTIMQGSNIALGNTVTQNNFTIEDNATLKTNANNLTISNAIDNNGTLILTDGILQEEIIGSGTISVQGNVTIQDAITNNIKLNNGTMKLASTTNISNSTLLGGNGTLSVVDDTISTSNLGNINLTNGNLNLALDADLSQITGNIADKFIAQSVTDTNNQVLVKNINLVSSTVQGTPAEVQIVDAVTQSALANKIGISDNFSITSSTDISSLGDFLVNYNSGNGTLAFEHSTLQDAISSTVLDKNFSLNSSQDVTSDLGTLGGTNLAIAGGGNILSSSNGSNGITIDSVGQKLTLNNITIKGFNTAIDNTAGGKLGLNNVVIGDTQTTTDNIINNGILNIKGITNKIFSAITGSTGSTIVEGNLELAGTIAQNELSVNNNASLKTNANSLTIANDITNNGSITLTGGTLEEAIAGSGSLSIQENTTLTGTINQNSISVAGGKELTSKGTITLADDFSLANGAKVLLKNSATFETGTGKSITLNNAGMLLDDNSSITTTDLTVNNNSLLQVYKDSNINANNLNVNNSTLELIDGTPTLSTPVTFTNNSTLALNARDNDMLFSSMSSFSGSNYKVSVLSDPSYSVTMSSPVVGATEIFVNSNSNLVFNDTALASDTPNFTVQSGSNLTLNNTLADSVMNFMSQIRGTNYNLNISNVPGDGSVALNTTVVGANEINVNSGTLELSDSTNLNCTAINLAGTSDLEVRSNSGSYALTSNITGVSSTDNEVDLYSSSNATKFTLNSTLSDVTLALDSGELILPDQTHLVNSDLVIGDGSTLNTVNGTISEFINTAFEDNAQIKIDLDVLGSSDKFISPTMAGSVILSNINPMNMEKIVWDKWIETPIDLKDTTNISSLTVSSELQNRNFEVLTPVRRLSGSLSDNALFTISPTGNGYKDFNPAVMASPVAAQLGGYFTQLNSYDEAFRNMDMYMLMTASQRQAMKFKNRYAASDSNLVFDPTITKYERKDGWFRPYATFENVPLKNGPKVSNVAYGSFMGADSELYDLGRGWDGMYGIYLGYNGSHQAYDGVGIYQNGGTLGVTGMAFKGNFFTGLTINAGANAGEASTMYGTDNFSMLMAGIASKSGYNWELARGKFIIQPSFLMSYSFVNTFDYTNAAGVRLHSSPLNAIQLEPGLKFIGNLKNGWQPYAGVSMVWNIMDQTQFRANDISLSELSIKPYVRYGVGVRKAWGENFTGFFQTYLTNGGRNGVGLQCGFRWALGKSGTNAQSMKINPVPTLKKAQVTLNNLR